MGGPDNWGEVARLNASDAADDDWFGVSVSVSGNTVFVGASRNDDAGANFGSAYVFDSVGCPFSFGTGDCDGDGDVDLVDFASFQLCFTGPGDGPVGSDCNCADFDSDDDVDLADFGSFQLAFTGSL